MNAPSLADVYSAHVEAFDLHVRYEERAAILEYDGGWLRREAERLARAEVYRSRHREDPS